MPLPANITPIAVSATYTLADGSPASGKVTFTPSITATTDGTVFPIKAVSVGLDYTGSLSVQLAATDDADWEAPGFTYTVKEEIDGALVRTYSIQVPAASPGGALDLATVSPVVAVVSVSPYVKKTGDDMSGSLSLTSTFDGGENTSDSTSRINLQSYQRAQKTASPSGLPGHFGEPVRIDLKRDNAKGMVAWREDYTGDPDSPRTVAWIGAHGKSNDGLNWHNHISIETPDENGDIQTRFEIPFAPFDQANGYGISYPDGYCRSIGKLIAGAGGPLIVEGASGVDRNLQFHSGSYGQDVNRRWDIRMDSTAESGSNAGSDLRIVRRTDAGVVLDTAVFIDRSNGFVGIGSNNTTPTAQLDVDAQRIRLRQSLTPASASASGSQGNIAWDANFIYVCVADNTWKRAALATW